jgi:hypothetical protein
MYIYGAGLKSGGFQASVLHLSTSAGASVDK